MRSGSTLTKTIDYRVIPSAMKNTKGLIRKGPNISNFLHRRGINKVKPDTSVVVTDYLQKA
jgi:hypothetical protein